MKTFFHNVISWLHSEYYKAFPHAKNPFFKLMFRVRYAQAIQAASLGSGWVVWIGDSRVHEFENEINARPKNICLGISGTKIEDWDTKEAFGMIMLLNPSKIVDDIGGNNALAGETLYEIVDRKHEFIAKLAAYNYICCEIPNVGTEIEKIVPGINEKMKSFNAWLATQKIKLVKLCDAISPQGFLAPEFDCGDHVHYSASAWPVIAKRVDSVN